MEEEKVIINDNSEAVEEIKDIKQGKIEKSQDNEPMQGQEDKNDEIRYTNEVFMKGVVKFAKETKPTKKEILIYTKLMPEELKRMEEVMEETHPKWYEEYIFALRVERPQMKNSDEEIKEESTLFLDEETKEVSLSGIVVPLRDAIGESENSGIIELKEEDRKREKGSFRTIKDRVQDGEMNIEDILNDLIQEKDEKAVFRKYRVTNKADIEEFYLLAMKENYHKYKRVIREKYNTDFKVNIEGKKAVFILERPFEDPVIREISINELLKFLIQTGEISPKDVRWLDYIRKKQVQIKPEDFIEILATGKNIEEFYGKDRAKEAIVQLKKCANILLQEGEKSPEKMQSKNDTANFVNNLTDQETEYEAALRLYAFIKKGGPIEKEEGEISLSQACMNAAEMFGKDDKVSNILLSDGITQLRILNKVQHLNEIEGPDGKVMQEEVKISEHLKISDREKAKAKSTLGEALGDFNIQDFLTRGVIA